MTPNSSQVRTGEYPRVLPHHLEARGWLRATGSGVLTPRPGVASDSLKISLIEVAYEAFRIHFALTASGIEVLRFGLRSRVYRDGTEAQTRERSVVLDIARPGALHHEMERVALYSNPSLEFFELLLEGVLASGEVLREISITPTDVYLNDVPPSEGMAIGLHRVVVEQVPRISGVTRFVPDRFPDRPLPRKNKNGKRDAVVFAWFVPDQRPEVGDYWLGILRYHHPDSKFFIGMNHGSDPAWEQRIRESGLDADVRWARPEIDEDLWDTAGFITALEGFFRDDEAFDLVWFGHTKGSSRSEFNDYRQIRARLERRFWSARPAIDRIFSDPKIGIFAPRTAVTPTEDKYLTNLPALQRIYTDRLAPLGLFAYETFYVMRGEILRAYCDRVGASFFVTSPYQYGGNRWFFEMAVPSIASMQGYEPFIDLDVEGANDPRDNVSIDLDVKQNHRLAMEELQRWRTDPIGFERRALPWTHQ